MKDIKLDAAASGMLIDLADVVREICEGIDSRGVSESMYRFEKSMQSVQSGGMILR